MVDLNRIKQRMSDLNLSIPNLADEIMMSVDKVEKVITEQNVAEKHIEELASSLLCNKGYLIGETDVLEERMDIGCQIKKLRYEKGLSAKDLAAKTGISSYIEKNIEANKMQFADCLEKIAVALGKSKDFFSHESSVSENPENKANIEPSLQHDKQIKITSSDANQSSDAVVSSILNTNVTSHKKRLANVKTDSQQFNHPFHIVTYTEDQETENLDMENKEPQIDAETSATDAVSGLKSANAGIPLPVSEAKGIDSESTPNQEDVFTIGARLEKLRIQKGYTTESLGRKSGCSGSLIRSIETGKANPRLKVLARIGEACEVNGVFLVSGKMEADLVDGLERDKELGDILKKLREDKEWKFSDLGKASGVSPSTITKIEYTSDTNLEIFLKLCNALKCAPASLMQYVKPISIEKKKYVSPETSKRKEQKKTSTKTNEITKIQTEMDKASANINFTMDSARKLIDSISEWKAVIEEMNISSEEKEIISIYRTLSDRCKQEMKRNLEFLKNVSENNQ